MVSKHENTPRLSRRVLVLLWMLLIVVSSCSAKINKARFPENYCVETDSMMNKVLGDSIYGLLIDANSITAETIFYDGDSTCVAECIEVNSRYFPLLHFILSDSRNYLSNMTLYGKFTPCLSLIFTRKKEKCIMRFDFALGKWAVYSDNGQELCRFDFPSINMLRFANMLFPNNKLYISLINTEKK